MPYREFCSTTLAKRRDIVSNREYVDIKMAIRGFSNPNKPQRDLAKIDKNLCLDFFIKHSSTQLKGYKIRGFTCKKVTPGDMNCLINWSTDLDINTINWSSVFTNMYKGFTNSYKIIQFQYKLLMRISTCRYMRFKMKIDNSPHCFHCSEELETLPHIFLKCPKTINFVEKVKNCIVDYIQVDYSDPFKLYYITCSHENQSINFLWAIAKYFISRSFQLHKDINWIAFKNFVLSRLVGEKESIVT